MKKNGVIQTSKRTFQFITGKIHQTYDAFEHYQNWINENERYNKQDVVKSMQQFKLKPKISILIPVYNVDDKWLIECVESIQKQYYENWELCMADDCSTKATVKPLLERLALTDERIKVVYREENGHISRATNSALAIATGDYIALVDNDDILPAHALFEVVKMINQHPDADLIYSDEDKINLKGQRVDPHFKPDFSPDTLLSSNYISHLGVYRKSIVDKIGGFRVGYEGSQDYDLVLRFTEQTNNIHHIPKILYHWRMIEGSTALDNSSKNYAYIAGKKALNDAITRRGLQAQVEEQGEVPYYVMRYDVKPDDRVSIIIPTRDHADLLAVCLESIYNKSTYQNFEVIVVDNGSIEQKTIDLFNLYKNGYTNFKVLRLDIPFNYSTLNNEAAKIAEGNYLLLLNNDIEIITPNWLELMVGYAKQAHIGAVGAKLLYPDQTIQHGGIILGVGGVANHAFLNHHRTSPGYFARLKVPYNYSGVTAACLMVEKQKFFEVNGLEKDLMVAFNDVDFNLKLLNAGYYNVFLPQVELYHYESKSRGKEDTPEKLKRFNREIRYMHVKWNQQLLHDRFYNPNFSYTTPQFEINPNKIP